MKSNDQKKMQMKFKIKVKEDLALNNYKPGLNRDNLAHILHKGHYKYKKQHYEVPEYLVSPKAD